MKRLNGVFLEILFLASLAAACTSSPSDLPPEITSTSVQAISPAPLTPSPAPLVAVTLPTTTVTFTPTPVHSIWIAPYLPADFLDLLLLPQGLAQTDDRSSAAFRLEISLQEPVTWWIYALVAPFSTLADGITSQALLDFWVGRGAGLFAGSSLRMDEGTARLLEAFWGPPASGQTEIVPASDLLNLAWDNQPAWAVIPFEMLEPRWKVLAVDGNSPLHKSFTPQAYALSIPISIDGSLPPGVFLQRPETNRQSGRLTTLVMTGVTALVRGTSNTMYSKGIAYPALDVGDILKEADVAHISNEIAFSSDCPLYHPVQTGLRFCTNPAYIQLLEIIGTDVVELTGDHFGDRPAEDMLSTLEMYQERGWLFYGGGADLVSARQPVLLEHNGNRLAFIGCNAKGGGYATASETQPGAAECDFGFLQSEIQRLRQEGYLPIVTFQHEEVYEYQPAPEQRQDFLAVAQAGAVIVSGSQAHQPQNFEFFQSAFIHYGLGNLFFDQYNSFPGTADAFIDRHVFYAGKHISTELITIHFIDLARPRLMTPEERTAFLNLIFENSGWQVK